MGPELCTSNVRQNNKKIDQWTILRWCRIWKWLSIKSISFCFRNKLFGQNSSVAISVWFGMRFSLLSLLSFIFYYLYYRFSLLSFLLTINCVSPYYLAIPLKRISPYCRVHFSLLHSVFKRSCSPHTKPDRDRNWRVLFEKLIAKAKWNRLYWKSFSKIDQQKKDFTFFLYFILFCEKAMEARYNNKLA